MPGALQAAFRKRLAKAADQSAATSGRPRPKPKPWIRVHVRAAVKAVRKAHGGAYQSITDEPPVRPTTPRLGADPYAKPKPKPKPPVKKHDTPKSPHKEHDPRYRQGVGGAVHAGKIHHELAAIFKGKYEGAGFMQNAPRPGFNVNISGDRTDIGRRFEQLEDVDGVWEGQREKAWMANFSQQSNPRQVLQTAAAAGLANDEDAVFVRFDGPNAPSAQWEKGTAFALQTPQGIIDMVDPSKKNLKAAAKMAKRFGGGQYTSRPVWKRLLEKGKHY